MDNKINLGIVSSHDLVGQRFNGFNLLEQLPENRFNKVMAVANKDSGQEWVRSLVPQRKFTNFVYRAQNRINDIAGLDGFFGGAGLRLRRSDFFRHLDLLHLQLTHNGPFFSFWSIPSLSKRMPTIWTLHDCWPFTGMCVYHMECDGWLHGCVKICPHPRGNSKLRHLTPAVLWSSKKLGYKFSDLTLIVASDWMKGRVEKSPLMRRFHVEKIPFGVDENIFFPHSRASARQKLGIDTENHVISFRGSSAKYGASVYPFKGMPYITEALEMFEPVKPTTLIVLEDPTEIMHLSAKFNIINIPWAEQEQIVDVLNASDIFLMPSMYESFGVMAIEAMACGTPVVGFTGTPVEENVGDSLGGRIVKRADAIALANAIQGLLRDEEMLNHIGKTARQRAVEKFTVGAYLSKHIAIYEELYERGLQKNKVVIS